MAYIFWLLPISTKLDNKIRAVLTQCNELGYLDSISNLGKTYFLLNTEFTIINNKAY